MEVELQAETEQYQFECQSGVYFLDGALDLLSWLLINEL